MKSFILTAAAIVAAFISMASCSPLGSIEVHDSEALAAGAGEDRHLPRPGRFQQRVGQEEEPDPDGDGSTRVVTKER
ncbi:hypothetical protein PCANC_04647 [Puccinia coronata f. sp. avenae]|uniref:Secreted protein n=1 Tax=Puccinia coronata f. sp. avenae TaxID=200324 RepID=A0A2N5W0B6_9BASI|nr:hypothetical protein PCANC_04647 [Puccinia coronata f. sp. avenae]